MANFRNKPQYRKRTPALCPRCESKLKEQITAKGEPYFIHPAKPSKDGTYTAALARCMYAGAILLLDQLRQLTENGFIPAGTEQLLHTIPTSKRLTRDQLVAMSRLQTAQLKDRQVSDIDRIVNAWYQRSYNYLLSMKPDVLH